MGTNNRDRRRQKKRRQEAADRARQRRRVEAGEGGRGSSAADIEGVLATAVFAQRDGDAEDALDLAEMLAVGPPGPGGQALVDAVVARRLRQEVAAAGDRGWAGPELDRVVQRRMSKGHARVLGIVSDAPGGAFLDHVAGRRTDRIEAVLLVIEVLALLACLPSLPKLRPAERTRAGVDGRMLERVRALLAKAESTTFPEEAEALSAKAQELMARHAIDRALLEATAGAGTGGAGGAAHGPSGRRLAIDDPYAGPKSLLLAVVADANRCRAVWSSDVGLSTFFGADDDLDIVELLFTSLLCQATAAMAAAGSDRAGPQGRRARSKSFRHSFLVAYATRIGARLREATDTATGEAAEVHGAERLLPVLAARTAAADAAAEAAFPHVTNKRFSVNDAAGWAAGAAAADLASLTTRPEVEGAAG
jgi:hypothetical protein